MDIFLSVLVFFPFLAGLLVYATGGIFEKKEHGMNQIATGLAIIFMLAEFVLCIVIVRPMVNGNIELCYSIPGICGFGIHFVMDGFRAVYVTIGGFMWLMTTLLSGQYFSHHVNVRRFYLFLFWTLAATIGVFLSADLYTTFIFFEVMSFTSYVWVAQEENRPSLRAAETYLAVAVIGGLVMLMGIFMLYHNAAVAGLYREGSPLRISQLHQLYNVDNRELRIAGICMLVGFGAKAGAFPLHIWLPKAHPVAPAPASALLSGILTKTGIFGILILSCNLFMYDADWGKMILTIGVITMFCGAVLAVFSVDLKRTLACSSMSQIGFILVGIGMQGLLAEENALAVHGTVLHMINHSLIKLVLFMAAGVVYMNAHSLDLNQIRGFGRKKPVLLVSFLIGALAIGGIPVFSGYVSKTLLHESIVEYSGPAIMTAVEWIFLFSGGLTVAYMTKLFVAIFVEKNEDDLLQQKYDRERGYMNLSSMIAMIGSATVLAVWGMAPRFTMDRVAELTQGFLGLKEFGHGVHYFNFENLKGALISIIIGTCIYLFFIRTCLVKKQDGRKVYVDRWPRWFDIENLLYRPLLLTILPTLFGILCRIPDCLVDTIVVLLRKTFYKDSRLPHERKEGNAFTVAVGHFLNWMENIGNHLWNKSTPHHVDYEHILAIKNEEIKENNLIIARSLSFGLLLFGVGLVLTLVYLFF